LLFAGQPTHYQIKCIPIAVFLRFTFTNLGQAAALTYSHATGRTRARTLFSIPPLAPAKPENPEKFSAEEKEQLITKRTGSLNSD